MFLKIQQYFQLLETAIVSTVIVSPQNKKDLTTENSLVTLL